MNPIIKGYLKGFSENHGDFGSCDESTKFEHFINWLILSKYIDNVEIDNMHTGGGSDLAIDGLAITINSFLVLDITQAEYYIVNPQ